LILSNLKRLGERQRDATSAHCAGKQTSPLADRIPCRAGSRNQRFDRTAREESRNMSGMFLAEWDASAPKGMAPGTDGGQTVDPFLKQTSQRRAVELPELSLPGLKLARVTLCQQPFSHSPENMGNNPSRRVACDHERGKRSACSPPLAFPSQFSCCRSLSPRPVSLSLFLIFLCLSLTLDLDGHCCPYV